jgi:hypothetical protein
MLPEEVIGPPLSPLPDPTEVTPEPLPETTVDQYTPVPFDVSTCPADPVALFATTLEVIIKCVAFALKAPIESVFAATIEFAVNAPIRVAFLGLSVDPVIPALELAVITSDLIVSTTLFVLVIQL